jgi:hypothetical protein
MEDASVTGAVDSRVFAEAVERERAALAAYDRALDAEQAAREALESLQCRVVIRWEEGTLPEDPEDAADSDYWVDEAPCALPAAHGGDHAVDLDSSEAAPAGYRFVLEHLRVAQAALSETLCAWQSAEETLDALRCGFAPPGEFGCVLRRGHDPKNPHEHPSEIRLMPMSLWLSIGPGQEQEV